MPATGETPAELLARATPLSGTDGAAYVERRGIPLAIAHEAGVRFAANFGGRPAVIAALRGERGELLAVHGRHLHANHAQDKMLTIGARGGVVRVLGGAAKEHAIVVEGLFDALSLSVCGSACLATIGRDVRWLREALAGRRVWIAFDTGRSGDAEAARLARELTASTTLRVTPPPRCKDWNTALVKLGASSVSTWLRAELASGGTTRA